MLNSDLPLGNSLIMPMAAPSVFRPPAGVMVIDWQGGAVHMIYIINTCIIAVIQYVELRYVELTGPGHYWASILMTCDTSTDTY